MKRVLLVGCLCTSLTASAAELRIQNSNGSGEGFNDTTPATPVGVNFGSTRGQQQIITFQYAAAVWGATLKSPVPTLIDAAFVTSAQDKNMTCDANSGLLGYTHPVNVLSPTSPSEPFPNFNASYVAALANALVGQDTTPNQAHILTRFNAGLGGANCLAGISFYFGLDNAVAPGQVALLATILHELAHGLGFSSSVNPTTGLASSPPGIFDYHVFDEVGQTDWHAYSSVQRKPLLVAGDKLAFDGANVKAQAATFLSDTPVIDFTGGGTTTEADYAAGQFSGPVPDGGQGPVVPAVPLDACSDLPAGSLDASVALVERGTCTFYEKSQRAVAAGASGVVVFDNDAGSLVVMATADGGSPLDVPAVFVTNHDGQAVLQQLTGGTPVNASFGFSPHLSNTDATQSRVLLYTPSNLSGGSTLSHWNSGSFPHSLLMEPFISASTQVTLDLTPASLADIGWPIVNGLSVGMSKALDATLADGAQATYLVAVFNRRSAAADGVTLDLSLPAGASVVSASGGCSAMPCTLGTMAAGELRPVVVTVQAPKPTVFPFAVTAQLGTAAPTPDDNLTATISSSVTSASGGGGCNAAGIPGAVVALIAALTAWRARRPSLR
jgi:hypothetical protein